MYPWRRILIPTDFSTASEWVFDDAVRIAASSQAEIVIVHVRMTWTAHPAELRLPADPGVYEHAEQIELERLREHVRRANASVPTRLVVKQAPAAGEEICRAAIEENVDLLVIATHARHHVAHLLIGSTTFSVISNPPAPVLAIHYGIRKRQSMRRIVVPVHLQQSSHAALDLASAIAAREGSEIHLLTICAPGDRAVAERLLADLSSRRQGVETRRMIITGENVEREIVRYAEKEDADAVFLNARQEPGPVKVEIIRHVPSPVMIVPAA